MDLLTLKNLLPRGSYREIAKASGTTECKVKNIFSERVKNPDPKVIDAALIIAEQEYAKKKAFSKRLEAICSL